MFSAGRLHNFPWMAQCYPYIFPTSQQNLLCCNLSRISPSPTTQGVLLPFWQQLFMTLQPVPAPAFPRLWNPNPSSLPLEISISQSSDCSHCPELDSSNSFLEEWKTSCPVPAESCVSAEHSVFCCCLESPRGKFPFIAAAPRWGLLSLCKLLKLLGSFCKKCVLQCLWSWQLLLNILIFFFPLLAEL